MSNIRADTLSTLDGTKSITTDRIAQGVARAWVNFNGGGTVAIRASFNVSSITDNGVGLFTVNFATAMPDNNSAVVVTGADFFPGTATSSAGRGFREIRAINSSSAVVNTMNVNGDASDHVLVCVSLFR